MHEFFSNSYLVQNTCFVNLIKACNAICCVFYRKTAIKGNIQTLNGPKMEIKIYQKV